MSPTLDTDAIARVRAEVQHARDRKFIAVAIDLADAEELLAAIDHAAAAAELRAAHDQKFLTDVTSRPASECHP